MRASHDQTSPFQIDEDRLHGLRRHEGRTSQLGIRNPWIVSDRKQDCVLRRSDAKLTKFGIQALSQSMLRDLQVVADPVDPGSRCDLFL